MTYSIHFDSVSKRYRIGRKLPSIREALGQLRKGVTEEYHTAVDNVSFQLQAGDSLGIIGPNGAGKTTILKLLSKVTHPTSGEIKINGRLSALIELGAGFHPDLTGRENIFLNGAILGMKKADIQQRFDDIVEFAGIGKYLDTPVKRYSSGMYARLGFAIAAHVDPEILLVDEVLAVGDYAFRQKCHARMDELRKQGTSIIFVAHDMEAVRRVCNKGVVMYRGRKIFDGSAAEAVIAYSDALRQAARDRQQESAATLNGSAKTVDSGLSQRIMTFDAEIEKVRICNEDNIPVTVFNTGDKARVVTTIKCNNPVNDPIFSLTIRTPDGNIVYDTTTRWQELETPSLIPGETYEVVFDLDLPLLDGEYELGVDIAAYNWEYYYDRVERALSFWVKSTPRAKGLVDLNAQFSLNELSPQEQKTV